MSSPSTTNLAGKVYEADLSSFGGILRCLTCGREQSLERGEAERRTYDGEGWPKCCGHTMRWITERELKEASL